MTANTYALPRDRDAYATIRGYVYQVELTIRRWLDLDDAHHLELECGEDIDRVSRAIGAADSAETARLLEQVKHREQNLTLRTPAAIEAIANAVEHLVANPALSIRFCFTTNARIGAERPCPFPDRASGIRLWERVRNDELNGAARAQAVGALRRFLRDAARPKGFDEGVWKAFQRFLADPDEIRFADLVGRFEWSTAAPEARAVGSRLRDLLVERGLATDAVEAEPFKPCGGLTACLTAKRFARIAPRRVQSQPNGSKGIDGKRGSNRPRRAADSPQNAGRNHSC